MTEKATIPDEYKDLLDAPVAILATNGASGRPQVSAISFLYDTEDGLIKISLNDTRQKMKNLRRDPKCTLLIVDPQTPYRTLEIRADAEIRPDPDFSWCARIGKGSTTRTSACTTSPGRPVAGHPPPRRVVGTDLRR